MTKPMNQPGVPVGFEIYGMLNIRERQFVAFKLIENEEENDTDGDAA